MGHHGFDPSTLVYWRKRLARSDRPHRINEAVRRVVAETGILGGRRKRAVDSTILADAVATQDTITQLVAAIRRVGRIVPGGAEAIVAVCTAHDYHRQRIRSPASWSSIRSRAADHASGIYPPAHCRLALFRRLR